MITSMIVCLTLTGSETKECILIKNIRIHFFLFLRFLHTENQKLAQTEFRITQAAT